MVRRWAAALTAGLGLALALHACGGGNGGSTWTGPPTETLDPNPPRPVAKGTTLTYVETGPARDPRDGLPKLETAAAAREECHGQPAPYLAWSLGIFSDDLGVIAREFARLRAAPGAVDVVRRGCRAGLYR